MKARLAILVTVLAIIISGILIYKMGHDHGAKDQYIAGYLDHKAEVAEMGPTLPTQIVVRMRFVEAANKLGRIVLDVTNYGMKDRFRVDCVIDNSPKIYSTYGETFTVPPMELLNKFWFNSEPVVVDGPGELRVLRH